MTIEKANIKKLLVQDIGKNIDNKLGATKVEINRLEGASSALHQAQQKLEQHKSYWQQDFKDKAISQEEVTLALKVIDQCQGILRNLNEAAKANKLIKEGEHRGLTVSNDVCEKIFNEENNKIEAMAQSLVAPEKTEDKKDGKRPKARATGVRPGKSEAQKRKVEEAKKKKVRKTKKDKK